MQELFQIGMISSDQWDRGEFMAGNKRDWAT